jgi:hypothetical protein
MQRRGVIPKWFTKPVDFLNHGCSVREGTYPSKGRHGEEREDQGPQCHSPSSSNPFRESRKSPTSISNSITPDLLPYIASTPRCRMTGSSPSLRSRGHAQRRSHGSTALGPPGRILGHPERFARGAVRQVGHASAAWRPGPVWLHEEQGALWRASTPPTAPGMAVWSARPNAGIRSNRFPTATPDGACPRSHRRLSGWDV